MICDFSLSPGPKRDQQEPDASATTVSNPSAKATGKPGSPGVRKRDTASSTQETPKSAKPMPPAGSEQEPRSKVPTDQVSAGHSHVSDMLSGRAQPRFLHGGLHGGLFASSPLTRNESKDDDYTKLLRTLHPWSAAYLTYIALIHQQRSKQTNASPDDVVLNGEQEDRVQQNDNPAEGGGVDNFAVNAGIGGADVNNGFRRDWLDHFYSLFCFLLLLSIAWSYSSVGKFVLFTVGLIILLLYQAGFFAIGRNRGVRHVHLQGVNNQQEQEPQPGGQVPPDHPQEDGQQEDQPQGDQPVGAENLPPYNQSPEGGTPEEQPSQDEQRNPDAVQERNHGESGPEQQEVENPEEQTLEEEVQDGNVEGDDTPQAPVEQPGVMKTLLIFIVSFFTSLVPQRPPEFVPN